MGAGKSTVGLLLSNMVGLKLVEIDTLVAERSGYPSIAALVDAQGESLFRDIESEVIRDLSAVRNVIISPGGGVIGRESNRKNLVTDDSTVVFLRTSFESVASRIGPGDDRPLFRDREKAKELFEKRQSVYEDWADVVIDTDGITPVEVTRKIAEKLGA